MENLIALWQGTGIYNITAGQAFMMLVGFLLLFLAVNIANVPLAPETGARDWISALAALGTAGALIVLCVEVDENPATRNHLWILLGMILVSFGIELGVVTPGADCHALS